MAFESYFSALCQKSGRCICMCNHSFFLRIFRVGRVDDQVAVKFKAVFQAHQRELKSFKSRHETHYYFYASNGWMIYYAMVGRLQYRQNMHSGTFLKSKMCKNIDNSRQLGEKKSSQFVKIFRKYSDSLLNVIVTPTALA